MDIQSLLHLTPDTVYRIEGGHRFLKYHCHVAAQHAVQFLFSAVKDLRSVQQDAAASVCFFPGQKSADAHGCNRFSGSALTYQAEDITLFHGK